MKFPLQPYRQPTYGSSSSGSSGCGVQEGQQQEQQGQEQEQQEWRHRTLALGLAGPCEELPGGLERVGSPYTMRECREG